MPTLIYWVYLQNVYTFFYKQPRIIFSSGITRGHDHDWHFPLKEPCKSFRFCQVCSIWFHTFSCLHSQVCIIWVREAVTACQSQPAIMAPQYVLMSSSFRTEWPLSCSGLRCFVCSALTIFQSSDWKKKWWDRKYTFNVVAKDAPSFWGEAGGQGQTNVLLWTGSTTRGILAT